MRPNLRFQGFESDWRVNIFSDFVTNKTSKFSPQENKSAIDIELDSIESNTGRLLNKYNSAEFSSQKNVFSSNQVLYSKLRPYLNKFYFPKFNGVCSSEIWVLNSKDKSILLNEFIYYFIQTSKFSNVANKSSGSKMPRADWELVKNIRLNLPSTKEQQKIGNFFSKLDQQIELEEKKLELLEQQKRGYMQKIFSQEVRFKDENGNDYPDWEETTLKNITNYISSKKSSNQYNESNNSKGYPVYDAIQEIGKDLQYDMEEPYISILKDGAGAGRLNLRAGKSSVIGTMGYIQANNVDIQFLYYRMKVLNFRKFIIGSTIPHLYYKDYSKEKILIPTSNDEQKKIGHFILNIDKLIDNKTLKLDYLKQRKQGLLQRMFV
ncbi:restriction endonuclease subunit S (plasmid) [Staphylococcus chromogenes]|uniref:restriction endonuclease subunit S n=1 Tax=Staphylococcus chromogenes TaxID=46126 RepID=UPI0014044B48|nr:restriction endonuclease subunit S [Staphylococcus chromogenes]QIN27843.1 restriction endonuclease subunit S [Staphylococcus chromogenes]